jgi:hypothetical protein
LQHDDICAVLNDRCCRSRHNTSQQSPAWRPPVLVVLLTSGPYVLALRRCWEHIAAAAADAWRTALRLCRWPLRTTYWQVAQRNVSRVVTTYRRRLPGAPRRRHGDGWTSAVRCTLPQGLCLPRRNFSANGARGCQHRHQHQPGTGGRGLCAASAFPVGFPCAQTTP